MNESTYVIQTYFNDRPEQTQRVLLSELENYTRNISTNGIISNVISVGWISDD